MYLSTSQPQVLGHFFERVLKRVSQLNRLQDKHFHLLKFISYHG
uniref:Uncharacterized protein n=1 Tax=Arundo donax TaxID=35708 RepID=A0A0A9ALF8_ARUDO